jgi:succinoglycan biosynthesis protein ExoA
VSVAALPDHAIDSAPSRIEISVLIPVRNEEALLGQTLATIRPQELDEAVEFLFLDGRSTDRTRAILERAAAEDPRIRVIDNAKRTIPSALNLGLRLARGRLIARMDAHTLYPPGYLATGIARLDRGDVACVTGPAVAVGVDDQSRRVALALSSWLGTGGAEFRSALRRALEVERGFGGIWHRSTLEAQDGWDERWQVNEDAELSIRIRRSGGMIVCLPEMTAMYVPRTSILSLARQYWRYGHYRARTTERHPGSLEHSRMLPPGLVLAVLVSVAGRGRLAGAARALVGAYLGLVALASIALAWPRNRRDSLALPPIFIAMHLSWGTGFLAGCVRFRTGREAVLALMRRGSG